MSEDKASDNRKCYEAIEARGATAVIPPRRDAMLGSEAQEGRFDNQAVEILLKCAALNQMIQLGKSESYKVES